MSVDITGIDNILNYVRGQKCTNAKLYYSDNIQGAPAMFTLNCQNIPDLLNGLKVQLTAMNQGGRNYNAYKLSLYDIADNGSIEEDTPDAKKKKGLTKGGKVPSMIRVQINAMPGDNYGNPGQVQPVVNISSPATERVPEGYLPKDTVQLMIDKAVGDIKTQHQIQSLTEKMEQNSQENARLIRELSRKREEEELGEEEEEEEEEPGLLDKIFDEIKKDPSMVKPIFEGIGEWFKSKPAAVGEDKKEDLPKKKKKPAKVEEKDLIPDDEEEEEYSGEAEEDYEFSFRGIDDEEEAEETEEEIETEIEEEEEQEEEEEEEYAVNGTETKETKKPSKGKPEKVTDKEQEMIINALNRLYVHDKNLHIHLTKLAARVDKNPAFMKTLIELL